MNNYVNGMLMVLNKRASFRNTWAGSRGIGSIRCNRVIGFIRVIVGIRGIRGVEAVWVIRFIRFIRGIRFIRAPQQVCLMLVHFSEFWRAVH